MKVPLEGSSPVTLASGRPFDIAVDGASVYWTGDFGTVKKVAIGGGTPVTLALGNMPMGIAVDRTSVYWTDFNPGGSFRLPHYGGTVEKLTPK